MVGLIKINDTTDNKIKDFDIKKLLPVYSFRTKLIEQKNTLETEGGSAVKKFFYSVSSFLLAPFVLVDGLIFVLVLTGYSFAILPALFQILLITPISIIIIIDYVIPVVRGN